MKRLTVSRDDPHSLATEDGVPIFLLGDTAWELLHRLTRDEMLYYLAKRASQGFNLVCTVVLAEFEGLTTPNAEGHCPLIDLDPRRLCEPYFELVDFFIQAARDHGIYVGLLPTWGDKMTAPWGAGPRIFEVGDPAACHSYGQSLAARYKDCPNIFWILGGDRPANLSQIPENWAHPWEAGFDRETDWEPLWNAMAAGIRSEIPSALIAYHPQGGSLSTSQLLPDAAWLDVNMVQSGHGGGRDVPVWDLMVRDYAIKPPKPTLDAEPNYEDHAVSPWPVWDPANGFFDDYDVRKQCYRSVFAGGCSVVYGHGAVWQFWDETRVPILIPQFTWKEALDRPGANQLRHLRELMESFEGRLRVPDDTIVLPDPGIGANRTEACRSAEGDLAYVYLPNTNAVTVRLPEHRMEHSRLSWICPKSYRKVEVAEVHQPGEVVHLTPPTTQGPDWVLEIRAY